MNKRKLLLIASFAILFFMYFFIVYYNSDEVVFNRYLDKIIRISRDDVKAIDLHVFEKGKLVHSYFDKKESYLLLDALHDIKSFHQTKNRSNSNDYSYRLRNIIETSDAIYEIKVDVDASNYDLKINEITVDMNENKKITITRYFKSDEKMIAFLKEIVDQ